MSVTTRLPRAARAVLARLVAVATVLTGIVLAHGIQCTSAMAATIPAAMDGAATASMHRHAAANHASAGTHTKARAAGLNDGALVALIAVVGVSSISDISSMVTDSTREGPGAGGLLAACMILLVAVTAAVMALQPTWRRLTSGVARSDRIGVPRHAVAVPAPSLAQLCLLRT